MTPTAGLTDRAYLVYLRRLLLQRFSLSELQTMCFDLGVDAQALSRSSLSDLARAFVEHMAQRDRIAELVAYIRETRDDIDIAPVPAATQFGDAASSGLDPALSLRNPHPVWSELLPGQPVAAPVLLGETCLVAYQVSGREGQGGAVRAFQVSTGDAVWEQSFPGTVMGGLTAATETLVLASLPSLGPMGGESAVVALNNDGRIVWQADLDVHQITPAASAGNLVAVTGNARHVILIDGGEGDIIADVIAPVQVAAAAPACDGDAVYIPCRTPTLLALSRDGEVRWRFDVDGVLSGVQLDRTPLVAGDLVVAVLSCGSVLALSRKDGTLVWEAQVGPRGKRLTSPVTDGRRVFVGARDGVYALSLEDGTPLWVFRTGAYVTAPPALDRDLMCLAGNDRHLYGVDRCRGSLLWQVTMDQELKVAPRLAAGRGDGPYVVTVDCAGGVTALSYPVPAPIHEAAGRWSKAARLWEAEGEPARAAEAWVRHAESMAGTKALAEAQAEGWSSAARLYASLGVTDRAALARRNYAEALGLPLVTLEVQHDGLVSGAWSSLQLKIQNEGYGVARDVVIRAAGDRFEGQLVETRTLAALGAGESLAPELTVKPLSHGNAVPLAVQISYRDGNGEPHRRDELLKLRVSRDDATRSAAAFVIPAYGPARRLPRGYDDVDAYVDIEVRLRRGRRDYDVELTLNGEQVFSGGRLSRSIGDWEPSGDTSQDGQFLFESLTRDRSIAKGWNVARGQAEERDVPRRIRLRIDEDASELHQLPWELLQEDEVMLSASERTPFSRYLPIDKPWGTAVGHRPIRVLAAIANPSDITRRFGLPPINADLERYLLARAFAGIEPGQVQLNFLTPPTTLERLSRTMLEGYDWLHFIGHGRFNARYDRVDLLMEDDRGQARTIGDRLISGVLGRQGVQPQLVFLSVCQSAGTPQGEVMQSLAPQLVRVGVPAVVAMRGRLPMRTAQAMTRAFYHGVVIHGQVDRALNEARHAVLSGDLPEATAPVLFMHLSSGRLWHPAGLPAPA